MCRTSLKTEEVHTYLTDTIVCLCCPHPVFSQALAKLTLKYCHTGYRATHNTLSVSPAPGPTATYTATIPQANSSCFCLVTHLGPSGEWPPVKNMLLIYINFIICLSASLVVCICPVAHPHTCPTTPLAGCGPGSAGRAGIPARGAGAQDSAQARAAARSPGTSYGGRGGPPSGSRSREAGQREPSAAGSCGGAQPPATTQTDQRRRRWVRALPSGWLGPRRGGSRAMLRAAGLDRGRGPASLAPGRMLKAQCLRIPCGSDATGAPAPASGRLSSYP